MSEHEIVWRPSEELRADANLTAFMEAVGVDDYEALLKVSNEEPERFHDALIRFLDYRFVTPYETVVDESDGPAWTRWCVGGTTNVVINCLDKRLEAPQSDKPALVWEGEDGTVVEQTYADLHRETCKLAGGLKSLGLGRGDVVGMYLPNIPEAAATLLAVAKIGGIVLPLFSGFGAEAVAARLAHGHAKAVVTVDGSPRRGKAVGAKSVVDEAAAGLPELQHVIVCRHVAAPMDWVEGRDHWWDDLVAEQPADMPSEAMNGEDPFMLIYTSGTTGRPKGVVHTHCGFPIKTGLDLGVCMDFRDTDRMLWMSDMGWLVGPILIYGVLGLGGTVILAEGTPNYPEPDRLWRLIDDHRVSFLGIAPTVVRAAMVNGTGQLDGHDLSSLRIFTSTGEPWTTAAWMWLFEHVGKSRIPVLNYSGGTEMGGIVSSTVIHPLKPCSFAGPVPGTGAAVVDDEGNDVAAGTVGELVMRRPTIGLTRGLWENRDGYLDTYWNVIPGIWVHGDFAYYDGDGFWFITGRSDDTLKIAGKRTGPSEIEELLLSGGRLAAAAAIGAPDPVKGTAIVCVCVPADGAADQDALRQDLVDAIVRGLGAPYRPKDVLFVSELPMTRNMKIIRRVIRAAYLGTDPGDLSSLVNPEAVDELNKRAENRRSG